MTLPDFDILKAIRSGQTTSEVVSQAGEARRLFSLLSASQAERRKAGFHPLTPTQIRQLEAQGNTATDWKTIGVGEKFDPKRVARCHFAGPVLLEGFSKELPIDGVRFPTGLSHATLSLTVVGKDALIRNVRLVNRAVFRNEAILFDVGTLTLESEEELFANGQECLIAIETGGREIRLFAELTVDGAWVLARSRGDKKLLAAYGNEVEAYVKKVSSPCNILGPSARMVSTPTIRGLFLGAHGRVESALTVSHATVLSSEAEPSEISAGAIVRQSILQWGCEVTTGGIVDSSLLTEHSHVERHGKVTHSILGPNTGVAEGEVTSALLGPFVGFHHQALLIAALWPEGKGNVGYGANIGSNHTAKAPDQEIWPGEGTFFGLGVNIKFPTDLTRSPYTIIASSVNMLPQKLEFPFSLINTPAASYPGISPAYNELIPAWVLSDNIYTVKRNEGKYAKRNKARRSTFDFEVFRPEIVDLMLDARRRLQVNEVKKLYTPKEIEGLGKNVLLEPNRKKAIETYTFYARYYALLGLKRQLEALLLVPGTAQGGLSPKGTTPDFSGFLTTPSSHPRWEHERKLIHQEFTETDLSQLLKELVRMQERIDRDVLISKEKDDRRGAEVIEDYAQAHPPASEDSFVQETHAATEKLKAEIDRLLFSIQKLAIPSR